MNCSGEKKPLTVGWVKAPEPATLSSVVLTELKDCLVKDCKVTMFDANISTSNTVTFIP